MRILYFVTLFLILLMSCNRNELGNYNEAIKVISESHDLNSYEAIILIPYRGCGGCVGTTIEYIKSHDTGNILKVYFDYNSLKDIKIRMRDHLERDTFIDDDEELFQSLGPLMYPVYLNIENSEAVSYTILDPAVSRTFWLTIE